jgi:membrane protein required for beta-lactamase induction
MIHMAHASRYHWGQDGTELHFARGEWQISRVYALVGNGESALYHGEESLRLCTENGIGDFDLAFAYEAVARAYSVLGNEEKKMKALASAKDAANAIEKDEDKEYVLSEIDNI